MFFLSFVPYWKTVLHAKRPKLARWRITFDGHHSGSTNHVFGPVKLHDYLFKLSRLAGEAGRPSNSCDPHPGPHPNPTAPHADRAPPLSGGYPPRGKTPPNRTAHLRGVDPSPPREPDVWP